MKKIPKEKLVTYIRRNPGLTCCQLVKLLRGNTATRYTVCSFSSRLHRLANNGDIQRVQGCAVHSDKIKAWRYFPTEYPQHYLDELNMRQVP
jgi:hypothetical protein